MQFTNLSGYRWKTGTATVADMTDTYAVESFPDQGDQRGVPWMRPQSRGDVVTPHALVQAIDGTQKGYGGMVVTWEFPWLSRGMMEYLWETLLSSDYSASATIRTFDRQRDEWVVYNCTALWPTNEQIEGLKNIGGGFENFPIRFINCTAAAAS